jgi:hypothetical protein
MQVRKKIVLEVKIALGIAALALLGVMAGGAYQQWSRRAGRASALTTVALLGTATFALTMAFVLWPHPLGD